MAFDLHLHSTRSDGTLSPTEVVERAAAVEGLDGLALTDHDTTDGWGEAAAACSEHELDFVGGLELSTEHEGRSVHVLAYDVDPGEAPLVAELARLRAERGRRSTAILARLADLGAPIDGAAVAARAGEAPIGRPHIADVLVSVGHASDREDAFRRYLADDGPAWVPKEALAPADGVRLIREAGGVAVLAHPASSRHPLDTEVLPAMVAAGLAGVEADHAGQSGEDAQRWRAIATSHDLVVTGGSDFHGPEQSNEIGTSMTSTVAVAALRRRAGLARTRRGARW